MTVSELVGKFETLLGGYAGEVKVGDEDYNIPKVFPSICIEVSSMDAIEIALGSVLDERVNIQITYYEEAPDNNDKRGFLQNVENIIKGIMASSIAQDDMLIRGISSRKLGKRFGEGKWYKEQIRIVGDIEL